MSYTFKPLSDEEIESGSNFKLLEEGEYTFEVEKSVHEISKNNNPMAKLIIRIWDNDGLTVSIFDYLIFSNVGWNIKKIKKFCNSVGLQDAYKKGQLPDDLAGFSGRVLISIQEPMPKKDKVDEFHPRKNIVKDYVLSDLMF